MQQHEVIEDAVRAAESYRKGHDLFARFLSGERVSHSDLSVEDWERACDALDMVEAAEAGVLDGAA